MAKRLKHGGWSSEASLAALITKWLKENHYSVYEEVSFKGGLADVVAVKDGLTTAIEAKLCLSLKVLEQASFWRHFTDWSFVAVPFYRRDKWPDGWRFGFELALDRGISIMTLDAESEEMRVTVSEKPFRPLDSVNYKKLHAQLKLMPATGFENIAGTCRTAHWTPFKHTIALLTDYVKQHPGCTLRDVVNEVPSHYKSKTSFMYSVIDYLGKGVIKSIRPKNLDSKAFGNITLFPV